MITLLLILLCITLHPKLKVCAQVAGFKRSLDLKKHEAFQALLFRQIDGFALSRQARLNKDAMEYTYGEIDFMSFIALLSLTKPHKDTTFYDLGSGVGKTVVACALVFNIKKSVGVELFAGLHKAAVQQKMQLQKNPQHLIMANKLHFIHDDFLNVDLHEATIIFLNATALFGETWEKINQKMSTLSQKVIIITTSKPLIHPRLPLLKQTWVQMNFGIVRAFLYGEP